VLETSSPRNRAARARERPRRTVRAEECEAHGFTCGLFDRLRTLEVVEVCRGEPWARSINLDVCRFKFNCEGEGYRVERSFGRGVDDAEHRPIWIGCVRITRQRTGAARTAFLPDLLEGARAEQYAAVTISLHPSVDVDGGIARPSSSTHATLKCLCAEDPIAANVTLPVYHNHLCGCSRCWKPEGALLAQTAIVARNGIEVVENSGKLRIVDTTQSIWRHACTGCSAHLYGDVTDADHHF
jgi:hypothetical protein